MPTIITVADLAPFASIDGVKAQAMIDDVLALAARVAPCILLPDFEHAGAAKAILRGAVLRWNESGSAGTTTQQAGQFGVTTTSARRSMFWPTEISDLQALCATSSGGGGGAFSVDTVPNGLVFHADICSLNFGALYCSCGASLTLGAPLWEV